MNKSICRVRELKDEVYPGTVIAVSACNRYEGGGKTYAPVVPAPAPVMPKRRDMKELANISARIQKITKEKTEDKSVKCPACGKVIDVDEAVTDASSGKMMCQDCYDKL